MELIDRQVTTLEHKDYWYARAALWRLATHGCDVAIVWQGLHAYVVGGESGKLHAARGSAAEVRTKLSAVDNKMRRILAGIRRERDAGENLELRRIFRALEGEVAGIEEQTAYCVASVLKSISDARGSYRKEAYPAALSLYLRTQTDRPCYSEMSLILDCVAASCRRGNVKMDPENIRRSCERYLNGEDAIGNAAIVLAVIQTETMNDRFNVTLRERLLAACAPARRTRTAAKSREIPS